MNPDTPMDKNSYSRWAQELVSSRHCPCFPLVGVYRVHTDKMQATLNPTTRPNQTAIKQVVFT